MDEIIPSPTRRGNGETDKGVNLRLGYTRGESSPSDSGFSGSH